MARVPVDDSKPPPWDPVGLVETTECLIDFCRRRFGDKRPMIFDAFDRPCRTVQDLERVIADSAFPMRIYHRQPGGRT